MKNVSITLTSLLQSARSLSLVAHETTVDAVASTETVHSGLFDLATVYITVSPPGLGGILVFVVRRQEGSLARSHSDLGGRLLKYVQRGLDVVMMSLHVARVFKEHALLELLIVNDSVVLVVSFLLRT